MTSVFSVEVLASFRKLTMTILVEFEHHLCHLYGELFRAVNLTWLRAHQTTSYVDQGLLVLVCPEKTLEEGIGRCQNYLVCINLLPTLTSKGNIGELLLFLQGTKLCGVLILHFTSACACAVPPPDQCQ